MPTGGLPKGGPGEDDGCARTPQGRNDRDGCAAGLSPPSPLFATRSSVGRRKITDFREKGLFNLIRGPRVVPLRQPGFDVVLVAHAIEDVLESPDVLLTVGELNTVVGEHGMDAVGHDLDQLAEELHCLHLAGALDQADKGELAGTVDADEEAQLALLGADLGDVDMEVVDRIALELFLAGLSPSTLGNREMPWRSRQRCRVDRVRCGMRAPASRPVHAPTPIIGARANRKIASLEDDLILALTTDSGGCAYRSRTGMSVRSAQSSHE